MSSTTTPKCFYATTRIFQGDTEFENTWDFSGKADKASAICHLSMLLEDASLDAFEQAYEDGEEINFYGMSPKEFATFLVENEGVAKEKFATTWEINTRFQEVDAEWEHPCNLWL